MEQLPAVLSILIEYLVQKMRLEEESKGGKVGQGSSPGKGVISPKIDPIVGIRYLFYSKRVYSKVTQIWDLPSECMGLIGEYSLGC